jgi:hypothetical protein
MGFYDGQFLSTAFCSPHHIEKPAFLWFLAFSYKILFCAHFVKILELLTFRASETLFDFEPTLPV